MNQLHHRIINTLTETAVFARQQYQESWLLRWVLLHIPAWLLAFALAILPVSFFGLPGMLFPGVIIGLVVGMFQRRLLSDYPEFSSSDRQNWVLWSGVAGCTGTIFVYVAGIVMLLNLHIGLLLMGAIFGAWLHGVQANILRDVLPDSTMLWIIAGLLGGGLCSLLTAMTFTANVPVFCSPGAPVFGLITGYTLRYLLREKYEKSDIADI